MTVTEARQAAADVLAQLPQQIHDALEHVSMRVVDRPPAGVPSDVKAIFMGHQQVAGPDDGEEEDDGDAGEHFDLDEAGDIQLVAVGGGTLAEGQIYLIAPNLADPADLEIAVMHEISHALGASEADAEELGLG